MTRFSSVLAALGALALAAAAPLPTPAPARPDEPPEAEAPLPPPKPEEPPGAAAPVPAPAPAATPAPSDAPAVPAEKPSTDAPDTPERKAATPDPSKAETPGAAKAKTPEAPPAVSLERVTIDPAEAEACERQLDGMGVRYTRLDPIVDEGGCGHPRPLKVTAVGAVTVEPAITVGCPVARAFATWVTRVVVPSAELHLKEKPTAVATAGSYQCRVRAGTATPSEHAKAGAIDVSAIAFARHAPVVIEPRLGSDDPARAFQEAIRGGACALFTTVLGPQGDPDHEDHLHLDLAKRRNSFSLCE